MADEWESKTSTTIDEANVCLYLCVCMCACGLCLATTKSRNKIPAQSACENLYVSA